MKKTLVSKLTAIVLSVLLMATSMTAFAETMPAGGAVSSAETTLTIPKGVTVKNELTGDFYGPTITYTYTIAKVAPAAGTTVVDANNPSHTIDVEEGPANGATLASSNVVFTSSKITGVDSNGKEVKQYLTVNIDLSKFTKPGVFRYQITDTTPISDLYAAGITRQATYKTVRYLDVFIKNGTSGLAVSGYALSQNNDGSAAVKDGGFDNASEVTPTGGENTDVYNTYNVRIEKKVTGDMGDKFHDFPFAVAVSNSGLYYYSTKDSTNNGTAVNGATVNATLKDGEILYIRGLNPRATIGVTETNNTADEYSVKIEGKADTLAASAWTTLSAAAPVAGGNTAALAAGAVSTYITANSATNVSATGAATNYRNVRFTNDLASISPTGVVLRYTPFILLLAGACVLVLVAYRSKAKRSNTESI
jgi:hypothetical protein